MKDTADIALGSLSSLRRHLADCRQCKLDREFCRIYTELKDIFEKSFKKWESENIITRLRNS